MLLRLRSMPINIIRQAAMLHTKVTVLRRSCFNAAASNFAISARRPFSLMAHSSISSISFFITCNLEAFLNYFLKFPHAAMALGLHGILIGIMHDFRYFLMAFLLIDNQLQ